MDTTTDREMTGVMAAVDISPTEEATETAAATKIIEEVAMTEEAGNRATITVGEETTMMTAMEIRMAEITVAWRVPAGVEAPSPEEDMAAKISDRELRKVLLATLLLLGTETRPKVPTPALMST